VKAGATWNINKLVFVNGGVDNLLNVDRRRDSSAWACGSTTMT